MVRVYQVYSLPLELVALVLFMVSILISLAILLPLLLAGRSRLKTGGNMG